MRAFLALMTLTLAACTPPATESAETATTESQAPVESTAPPSALPDTAQQAGDNCRVVANSEWNSGRHTYMIVAHSEGDTCLTSQVTITFSPPEGGSFTETFEAQQVMTVGSGMSAEDMERSLNEWVHPPGAAPDSTGDLPEWARNREQPGDADAPFNVSRGIDRTAYAALRAADAPMFCYVSGWESRSCVTEVRGQLIKIGAQSYPG